MSRGTTRVLCRRSPDVEVNVLREESGLAITTGAYDDPPFSITHLQSGLKIASAFLAEHAHAAFDDLVKLTDWTRSAESIRSDTALRDKVSSLLRQHGFVGCGVVRRVPKAEELS